MEGRENSHLTGAPVSCCCLLRCHAVISSGTHGQSCGGGRQCVCAQLEGGKGH